MCESCILHHKHVDLKHGYPVNDMEAAAASNRLADHLEVSIIVLCQSDGQRLGMPEMQSRYE